MNEPGNLPLQEDAARTKGERTAQRLLDVAEQLFADKGVDATSLREIAEGVGISEPGIYRHFDNKDAIYAAVLERGLQPMMQLLDDLLASEDEKPGMLELPVGMMERLEQHPSMAALFQRALLSPSRSPAQELMDEWLEKLFSKAEQLLHRFLANEGEAKAGAPGQDYQLVLQLMMINMFNICVGYFSCSGFFIRKGQQDAAMMAAAQKALLQKLAEGMLND